ncbi:hypothetical protein OROMI_019052 [Orobanche minor]
MSGMYGQEGNGSGGAPVGGGAGYGYGGSEGGGYGGYSGGVGGGGYGNRGNNSGYGGTCGGGYVGNRGASGGGYQGNRSGRGGGGSRGGGRGGGGSGRVGDWLCPNPWAAGIRTLLEEQSATNVVHRLQLVVMIVEVEALVVALAGVKEAGVIKTIEVAGMSSVLICASHWVLSIIDPENEKVYYLDPIRRRLPLGSCEWKIVVNSLKAAVPHQPDAIQCGYYVMRYMRDIVEDKDQFNFVNKWSRRDGGLEYTQDEIDVVRNEWAKFIVSTYV